MASCGWDSKKDPKADARRWNGLGDAGHQVWDMDHQAKHGFLQVGQHRGSQADDGTGLETLAIRSGTRPSRQAWLPVSGAAPRNQEHMQDKGSGTGLKTRDQV